MRVVANEELRVFGSDAGRSRVLFYADSAAWSIKVSGGGIFRWRGFLVPVLQGGG